MKKRDVTSLNLHKTSVSKLGNTIQGGFVVPLTKFNCNTQFDTCQSGGPCTTFPITCQTLNNTCPTLNLICQSLVGCA
ncbi:MAG: hypothetical protein AAF617_14600 [Bacteroidota bacterium]